MLKTSASRREWPGESPVLAQRAGSEGPRWTRAVGDSSEPSFDVYEQAWKDHHWSLAAALPGKGRISARQGWAGEKSGRFWHSAQYSARKTQDSPFR
jgi:hypothetical protein